MNKLKKFAITGVAYLLPLAVFAQPTEVNNIADLFNVVNGIINIIIPFIVGIAVFIIIWGVFTYIAGAGDEEKRATAKSFIIWGVVGVFIMLSIWGLVNILANSLSLKKDSTGLQYPGFRDDFENPTGGGVNPGVIPPGGDVGL